MTTSHIIQGEILPAGSFGLEDAIRTYLLAQGTAVGTWALIESVIDPTTAVVAAQGVEDFALVTGEEPELPDQTITVIHEGGPPATNELTEDHSVTVRCRSQDYGRAWRAAKRVDTILRDAQGVFDTGWRIARCIPDFQPIPVGRDAGQQGGRERFTQTFALKVRRTSIQ